MTPAERAIRAPPHRSHGNLPNLLIAVVASQHVDVLPSPAGARRTQFGFLAVPLYLSGPGMRLSNPAIVLPSYFSVTRTSCLEMASAAAVNACSLLSFSAAEWPSS